ncbi:aminotransferase class I/II-fold pyridoxal phosphate-dependent enzyme [Bradyrhizobium huanghuaihaiense]|uniref:aminotransferase class I/II-fold pyridoxal phosphate-dependent enzyme n=1 Tax=Bradyrhizobium huanghuaihaiense TaxID=990078 RepID=UPI003CC62CED
MFVDAQRPRYTPDVNSIRAAIRSRTKAMIINSPNNPTGAVYSRTTLQEVGELAIEFRIWIISDERYSRLVFTGLHRHESIVVAHPAVRSRAIIVNPCS